MTSRSPRPSARRRRRAGRGASGPVDPGDSSLLVRLPARRRSPGRELGRRLGLAALLLVISTLLVWFDRGAYVDSTTGGPISLVDAFYYSTVTVTTTGYGDITPVTPHSRLVNALVITPLRICFLVLLVGTTLEVLANEGRRRLQESRWRTFMHDHTIVIGYGTKGRSAVATLRNHDVDPARIVVIDDRPSAVAGANRDGLAAFEGDATRRDLLRRAEVERAREVIITVNRDDTAILATLTVRQLNADCHIVVSGREEENLSLLRQSGADSVVTSADAVGRLLGLSSLHPYVGVVVDDLLSATHGLEVSQRPVRHDEVGSSPADLREEKLLAVVRGDQLCNFYESSVGPLRDGDRLVVVRQAHHTAPREGAGPGEGR